MMRQSLTVLVLCLCLPVLAPDVGAHEVRPAYLELEADAAGVVRMFWKLPVLDGRVLPLTPRLPEHCLRDPSATDVHITRDARIETGVFACGETGLDAGRLVIDGLALTLIDVLVRLQGPDAEARSFMLRPNETSADLATTEGGVDIGAYLILGIEHILLGFDHLAFVLGLLVIVSDRWRLVQTITAFTIAHSITLALATLGLATAPGGPVEAVIALSILLLAVEITRRRSATDAPPSLLSRAPWVVAFGFGLLHGFGFAGALADVGLPSDAIPLALLLFNVGVELGQLAFVGLVLGGAWLARGVRGFERLAPTAAAYLIGVPAAYWSIDRVAGILARI